MNLSITQKPTAQMTIQEIRERKEKALAYYEEGHKLVETAEAFGVSKTSVCNWIKQKRESGYVFNRYPPPPPQELIEEALAYYEKGHTQAETSQRYNVNINVLRKCIKERIESGYTFNRKKRVISRTADYKKKQDEAIERFEQGERVYDIAKKYNISVTTVYTWIRQKADAGYRSSRDLLKRRKYDDDFKNSVLDYYKQHTAKETAEHFHICPVTVKNWADIKYKGSQKRNLKDKWKIDERIKEAALAYYEEGHSYKETAVKYRVSQSSIFKWVSEKKKAGYKFNRPPTHGQKIDDNLKSEALRYYEHGHSCEETGKKYGVSTSTIYKLVRKKEASGYIFNRKIRSCKRTNEKNRKAALEYYAQGHTLKETAKEIGLSISTIQKWIKCKKKQDRAFEEASPYSKYAKRLGDDCVKAILEYRGMGHSCKETCVCQVESA